jgi:hypothetical protein
MGRRRPTGAAVRRTAAKHTSGPSAREGAAGLGLYDRMDRIGAGHMWAPTQRSFVAYKLKALYEKDGKRTELIVARRCATAALRALSAARGGTRRGPSRRSHR